MKSNTIEPSVAHVLHDLISPTEQGISSRVLAQNGGGNMTLFSFDEGQKLSEHSAPFDALVMVLEGKLNLVIDGKPVAATPGTLVKMPANIPHSVDALEASRMLLVMLREPQK